MDVLSDIEIARPRAEVAAYCAEPDNATEWYANIKAVEWRSPRPLRVGTRLAFVARFLGRRLAYTYEVVELAPGERLVMRTAEGPFAMQTTYTWEDAGVRATRMTLRNRGEPAGFARLAAPMVTGAVRRANRKDLERLKTILEDRAEPPPSAGAVDVAEDAEQRGSV
jgi:Polyketide cyclase / dehydrase and lipid transport